MKNKNTYDEVIQEYKSLILDKFSDKICIVFRETGLLSNQYKEEGVKFDNSIVIITNNEKDMENATLLIRSEDYPPTVVNSLTESLTKTKYLLTNSDDTTELFSYSDAEGDECAL